MYRYERILLFISEQCREMDSTYRIYLYPRQILLGDSVLPLVPESTLALCYNLEKQLCVLITLQPDNHKEPLQIGITIDQFETVSLKDKSVKHPEPAILFRLKHSTLNKLVELFGPMLNNPVGNGNRRAMSRYLTVILGTDLSMTDLASPVHCRLVCLANKFTFPFSTAKKVLLADFPIMLQPILMKEYETRDKVDIHRDRESIADEMDDNAWDWFMGFMNMRWEHCPRGGYWLAPK